MSSPEPNLDFHKPASSPWERKVPHRVLRLYVSSLRNYPSWKKLCQPYLHPDVLQAVEISYNATRVKTKSAEYVFSFTQRSTIIDEINEAIETGQLEVRCNNTLVFKIGASCSRLASGGRRWSPRSIESFIEGPWVDELLELAIKVRLHERQQQRLERRQQETRIHEVSTLRSKLGSQCAVESPRTPSEKATDRPRRGLLARLLRRGNEEKVS